MHSLRPVLLITLAFLGYLLWVEWQKDYGPRPAASSQASSQAAGQAAGQALVPGQDALPAIDDLPDPSQAAAASGDDMPASPVEPAAGEMVLFDRSWYNRAGGERVMGFCTDEEYSEFMRSCPEFERMLVRSGIILIKYWFSVSNEEQERRFQSRIHDLTKRWKLSPMDLESRRRWGDYSKAKDEMFNHTDIKQAPWYVVNADSKRRARLNCITHLLSHIEYEDLTPAPIKLPKRAKSSGYVRPPMSDQNFVPEKH